MSQMHLFMLTSGLVASAMFIGYVGRKAFAMPEYIAEWCMWFVVVLGYSGVNLLSIWQIHLTSSDAWLPLLSMVFLTILTLISLALGPLFTRTRPMRGLFAVAGGLGNSGITMGAFLCYMLFGPVGLGLGAMYNITWNLVISVLVYPIARHYAEGEQQNLPLGHLVWKSVWDIRSMGLYSSLAGVSLSVLHVPHPQFLGKIHLMEILTFATTILAFFSVGLRLHLRHVLPLARASIGLGLVRFLIAPALGFVLLALNALSPWPLNHDSHNVFLLESLIPTAVTTVAVANLFGLRPREASAMFVVNTLVYLVLCVPVLLWWFR